MTPVFLFQTPECYIHELSPINISPKNGHVFLIAEFWVTIRYIYIYNNLGFNSRHPFLQRAQVTMLAKYGNSLISDKKNHIFMISHMLLSVMAYFFVFVMKWGWVYPNYWNSAFSIYYTPILFTYTVGMYKWIICSHRLRSRWFNSIDNGPVHPM